MLRLMIVALLGLSVAACSGSDNLMFVNTNAFGVQVEAPGPTSGGKVIVGQGQLSAAGIPQTARTKDADGAEQVKILSSLREAGAEGTESWAKEEDSRSVFFCTGSTSLLGRDADVGVDMIASTGNAASDAARFSRCSLGRSESLGE